MGEETQATHTTELPSEHQPGPKHLPGMAPDCKTGGVGRDAWTLLPRAVLTIRSYRPEHEQSPPTLCVIHVSVCGLTQEEPHCRTASVLLCARAHTHTHTWPSRGPLTGGTNTWARRLRSLAAAPLRSSQAPGRSLRPPETSSPRANPGPTPSDAVWSAAGLR